MPKRLGAWNRKPTHKLIEQRQKRFFDRFNRAMLEPNTEIRRTMVNRIAQRQALGYAEMTLSAMGIDNKAERKKISRTCSNAVKGITEIDEFGVSIKLECDEIKLKEVLGDRTSEFISKISQIQAIANPMLAGLTITHGAHMAPKNAIKIKVKESIERMRNALERQADRRELERKEFNRREKMKLSMVLLEMKIPKAETRQKLRETYEKLIKENYKIRDRMALTKRELSESHAELANAIDSPKFKKRIERVIGPRAGEFQARLKRINNDFNKTMLEELRGFDFPEIVHRKRRKSAMNAIALRRKPTTRKVVIRQVKRFAKRTAKTPRVKLQYLQPKIEAQERQKVMGMALSEIGEFHAETRTRTHQIMEELGQLQKQGNRGAMRERQAELELLLGKKYEAFVDATERILATQQEEQAKFAREKRRQRERKIKEN